MNPIYLELSFDELINIRDNLFLILENCEICPRKCHVNRIKGEKGYCKLGKSAFVFSYGPHFGEESVLVGVNGSGTIFFTSCNLSCVFCQNYEISQYRRGDEIAPEELASIMLKLQTMGCHNINLVSPTPQISAIVESTIIAREKGLKIPMVYNTNAYDSLETLRIINGIIDIYMPDAKYSDNTNAEKYSDAPEYFEVMKNAIREMQNQVGNLQCNKLGIAERGLIVRHLVLPNKIAGTEIIMKFLSEEISKNVFLNIMDQYYPCFKAFNFKEISRKITKEEYEEVVSIARKYDLKKIYGKNI